MKYELIHDSIARQVSEKVSLETRERRKIEKFLKERYELFTSKGVYLSEDDVDVILPFLSKININKKENDFLESSIALIKRDRLRKKVLIFSSILILAVFSIAVFLLYMKSESERERADYSLEVAQEKTKKLTQSDSLLRITLDTSEFYKDEAIEGQELAYARLNEINIASKKISLFLIAEIREHIDNFEYNAALDKINSVLELGLRSGIINKYLFEICYFFATTSQVENAINILQELNINFSTIETTNDSLKVIYIEQALYDYDKELYDYSKRKSFKNVTRFLIANNEIPAAIDGYKKFVYEFLPSSDYLSFGLLLSFKYKQLVYLNRMNAIEVEDYTVELNKLIESLLYATNEISLKQINFSDSDIIIFSEIEFFILENIQDFSAKNSFDLFNKYNIETSNIDDNLIISLTMIENQFKRLEEAISLEVINVEDEILLRSNISYMLLSFVIDLFVNNNDENSNNVITLNDFLEEKNLNPLLNEIKRGRIEEFFTEINKYFPYLEDDINSIVIKSYLEMRYKRLTELNLYYYEDIISENILFNQLNHSIIKFLLNVSEQADRTDETSKAYLNTFQLKILNTFKKGNLEEVFEVIRDHNNKNKDVSVELILLEANYNRLRKEFYTFSLSKTEFINEENQLIINLLQIVFKIENFFEDI